MTPPECFEPTDEAQRVYALLAAMLREERRRALLEAQEACARVGRSYGRDQPAVARCIAAIAEIEAG